MSGPTAVEGPEGPIDLRAKERSIVAALALHHPTPVTAASLASLIWGDELPATALKSIHSHVSRIRASAPALIDTAGDGYRFVGGTDVTSSGSTLSYRDLADQPQVAVERARDRVTAADAAPQRLIRWWWLLPLPLRFASRRAPATAHPVTQTKAGPVCVT